MAAQTEVGIRLNEQLGVNGTVGVMADGAAFAQGWMFIDVGLGLLLVALGAGFIPPRHRQPAFGLQDIHAVGIVALNTVHFPFQHRMMVRKMKFGLHVQVTLQAGLRVFAGVDDEFINAAAIGHGDVFAARAMAGFATVLAGHPAVFHMQPRMHAGGKDARDLLVAIGTGCVTNIRCALNLQRRNHGAVGR